MQLVKLIAASAKEKMGNAAAKIESKFDKSKAVANEKVGGNGVLAVHESTGEAGAHKEHKVTENESEKLALQYGMDVRKAAADDIYKNMD